MTLYQQIKAAEREAAMRRRVYTRRVATGNMRQETADLEIAAMDAIVDTLRLLRDDPAEAYNRALDDHRERRVQSALFGEGAENG
jgi:hypothetical protein